VRLLSTGGGFAIKVVKGPFSLGIGVLKSLGGGETSFPPFHRLIGGGPQFGGFTHGHIFGDGL